MQHRSISRILSTLPSFRRRSFTTVDSLVVTMKFTAACTLALVASASAFAPAPFASVSRRLLREIRSDFGGVPFNPKNSRGD